MTLWERVKSAFAGGVPAGRPAAAPTETGPEPGTEALRESEERLKTLINGTPDIICFKDGQGRWLEANDADLDLFHLKDVPYRGKTDSELAAYSPLHRAAFLACEASDEIAWRKGVVSRSEENIPRYDGTVSVYDVIKSPVFYPDGRRKGLVVLGRDITERKKAEDKIKAFNAILEQKVKDRTAELLASNEEMEAFAYSVSHDLKAPLRRMESFAAMLGEAVGPSLSGSAEEYLYVF
jgi:PAS domain S-box-containing protein